jgi:FkbM family methyltransferase
MNNGDDVEYYLLKAHRVVGVEANASLCDLVSKRFGREILHGRLKILNVALSDRQSDESVKFYIHKTNHVLSQLPQPDESIRDEFETVLVPSRTPSSIIEEFGAPLYVKIDVEHYDLQVLRNLFTSGIYPPEISAESRSVGVFACLVENGYEHFSLVDGRSVHEVYGDTTVQIGSGERRFAFKEHSAGPFGADIRTAWESADSFLSTLAAAGLGWKDIHARRPSEPASS